MGRVTRKKTPGEGEEREREKQRRDTHTHTQRERERESGRDKETEREKPTERKAREKETHRERVRDLPALWEGGGCELTQMYSWPRPQHHQRPPRVVENRSALQCSKAKR